jgi:hypothetical protein
MHRLDEIIAHFEGLGYEWDPEGWVFRPSRDGALAAAPWLPLQAALDAMPGEAPAVDRVDPVLD